MIHRRAKSSLATFLGIAILATTLVAATSQTTFTDSEKAIIKRVGGLRAMSDSDRAVATRQLALDIRALPAGVSKVNLANALANVSTEGDFGPGTLQEVTTTLALAARETPPSDERGEPAFAYQELAQLSKYEHMKVDLQAPGFSAAKAQLDAIDEQHKKVNFTLTDIKGTSWTLSALKGKVVLVNFWATWCPPCRKEMPDLQDLYNQFKNKGFVILSISDETPDKVNPFIEKHKYTWPILLDPGRKVNTQYHIQGIPKSFLYSRKGELIAQTIDMRTKQQFLTLLGKAGLQ